MRRATRARIAQLPVLDPADPPPSRKAWFITWVVLSGAFCVSFTITILSVSRPAIAKDLGADVSVLVWLISGPTIATALSSTTWGKLGDLHGHRRTYIVAMAGATTFALASAAAWDGSSLIAFRVLGALIGAATAPSSMAIINLVFPPERRSAALGYWSLVVAGGPVVGLVAGGPLVDLFGWRMIFLLQAPLLATAGLLAWWVLPRTPRRAGVPVDVGGQVTLAVALLSLLLAIDRGRPLGWAHPVVVGLFALALVASVAFAVVERRVEHPLVPLRYFSRRDFTLPIAIQFFSNFGYMGGFILAPKLLDEVRGMTPGQISLLLIPRPLVYAVSGPLAGRLVPRLGVRLFALLGAICVTASLAVIAVVSNNPTTVVVVAAIAISGAGMGAAQPAVASSVANAVEPGDFGVAGATHQLASQVGASIGMNLLDSIQVARVGAAGVGGSFAQSYGVGTVVTAVGIVLALGLRGKGSRLDRGPDAEGGAPPRPSQTAAEPISPP